MTDAPLLPRWKRFRVFPGEQVSPGRKGIRILVALLLYVGVYGLIHWTLGYGENIAAVIPVAMTAWYFRPLVTLTGALLTFPLNILMALASGSSWSQLASRHGAGVVDTLALVFVGGLISHNRTLYLSLKRARERVRMLSRFLPVCAVCRRVRDEQGIWYGMEDYLRRHSQAEFSHSLCVECFRRLHREAAPRPDARDVRRS